MKAERLTVLAASVLILAGIASATAQNAALAARYNVVYVPGLMTGPGSFGPIGYRRLCDLRVVGLVEWRVTWIESVINPTDAQKAALGNLQVASAQAGRTVAAACSRVRPATSIAELDMMGKRLDAVTQAFQAIRPAYEAFYATLDAGQKARMDGLGPQRRGWRW
jgi:hypothetical protein